jgi:hypothetical protein
MLDESPCETCPHIAKCSVGGLACEAFALFVSHGGRRWRKEPREPSAEIYNRIYRGQAPFMAYSKHHWAHMNETCFDNSRQSSGTYTQNELEVARRELIESLTPNVEKTLVAFGLLFPTA